MRPSIQVEIVVVCAMFFAVTAASRHLQTPPRVTVWDAGQYYNMTGQLARGETVSAEAPYVYRLGVPWLVSRISPNDFRQGFFVVNFVSGLAIALLLLMWLRPVVSSSAIRLVVVALFVTMWHGPVRYLYYNPGYVDPPFIVALMIGLMIVRRLVHSTREDHVRLVGVLCVLTVAGTLVRETMLLVPVSLLFVNNPFRGRLGGRPPQTPVPLVLLTVPLLLGIATIWFTHQVVVADVQRSFLRAALQWIHKPITSYLLGWFVTFGPVLSILMFDWRRSVQYLAQREWLLVFFLACISMAFFGGSDTERFLFWALPVVYLLLARAIDARHAVFSSAPLVTALVVAQALSARIFWGIPDSSLDSTSLGASSSRAEWLYAVLNRLFVFDDFHWNLWSSFGSRPFRLARLAWYAVVAGCLLAAMSWRAASAAEGSRARAASASPRSA